MVQRPVDLDLGQQLGALPTLLQLVLGDDFCGGDLLGLHIGALVALGEAALSQELAPRVALY